MSTVRGLLDTKGHAVWTIDPDASVLSGLELMAEKDIGALLVTEGQKIVGVFSERDYARKVVLHGRKSSELHVRDIMTAPVVNVEPQHSVDYCMALMTRLRIRHLPVMENGALVGLVSIGDVVKSIISDKEFMIEQLETYIVGGR